MRLSLFKKDNKFYIQIPDELAGKLSNGGEIEAFPLKDGFYLLTSGMSASSAPSGTKKEEKENVPHSMPQSISPQSTSSPSLTSAERKVLHGLLTIQFKDRTPAHVKDIFSQEELVVLKELERKKYVTVFYGTKYKNTGVYNIDNDVYPLLKGESAQLTPTAHPLPSTTQQPPKIPEILKAGYAIFQNPGDAQSVSDEIRKLPKGEVTGIKGFDGRYYAVTREYLAEISYNIKNNLKGDMNVAAIAKACKISEPGCRAVLYIMAERGDVIEKRKEIFTLV